MSDKTVGGITKEQADELFNKVTGYSFRSMKREQFHEAVKELEKPVEAPDEEDLFYIQDVGRGYVGNSMVWWAEDDRGYVCDIKRAKVWSKKEAEAQCKASDDLQMWDKSYIDERVSYHIDMQTVNKVDPASKSKRFERKTKK